MPAFICPVCLSTYEQTEIPQDFPCCIECNSDLPGDVELLEYDKFLSQVTVEQLDDMAVSIATNKKLRKQYRDMICGRIKGLIKDKGVENP